VAQQILTNLDFNGQGKGVNHPSPVNPLDVANKAYVDGTVQTVTTTSILTESNQTLILANSASVITITLMTAVNRPQTLAIKKIGVGNITIVGNGTQTIDAAANIQLRNKDSVTLISDGSNWWIV